MKKLSLTTSLFFFLIVNIFSQQIEKLKITEKEIPKEYTFSKKAECKSMQACMFYDQPDTYEMLIGKIKNKEVQNFKSDKDSGSRVKIKL